MQDRALLVFWFSRVEMIMPVLRNGDADAGDDFGKCIIIDAVVKVLGINVIRVFQSRYADRVRPTPNAASRCSACIRSPANS